jgi:hypothetical protein
MEVGRSAQEKMEQRPTDAENGEYSKAIQQFDGQLPAILPQLRFPEEILSGVGSGVRRRIELVNRAYSAAVYAHQDRFKPRRESLLSEPTRKLLRSEKEQLLCLFAQECFIVLGDLREIGGMARPIPVAERMALFNDYQAWLNRLKELLREAVFADEPESWRQALIQLSDNLKPGDPFPQRDFQYLVRRHVFSECEYLLKFQELFLTQMELEERFGLMIDIVLDLINAYEARMRQKMKARKRGAPRKHSPNTLRAAMTLFDALRAEGKPVNECWLEVHDKLGFVSPEAAKQAVHRFKQQNKIQN